MPMICLTCLVWGADRRLSLVQQLAERVGSHDVSAEELWQRLKSTIELGLQSCKTSGARAHAARADSDNNAAGLVLQAGRINFEIHQHVIFDDANVLRPCFKNTFENICAYKFSNFKMKFIK